MIKIEKQRIAAFDFIRAVCAIGIVFNHFTIDASNALEAFFNTYPNGNGSVGYSLVTVFFILSGTLLAINNGTDIPLTTYYRKRWKNIFPSFYLAYLSVFLIRFISSGMRFKKRPLVTFVFTLLGIDGYVSSVYTTWYILGEWFLGAIIILYLVFPLVLRLLQKNEMATMSVLLILYLMFLDWKMMNQNPFRNVFSCLISFVAGIEIAYHQVYRNKGLTFCLFTLSLVIWIFPLNPGLSVSSHIVGVAWFFVLFYLGDFLMKNLFISRLIQKVGAVSYEIFLLQHVIIRFVLKYFNPAKTFFSIIVMVLTTVLIYFMAYVLSYCSRKLMAFLGMKICYK